MTQSITPSSAAKEQVKSFPPSVDNYSKAIEQIKYRFARDVFCIELSIRDVLQLVLNQAKTRNKLPLFLSSTIF